MSEIKTDGVLTLEALENAAKISAENFGAPSHIIYPYAIYDLFDSKAIAEQIRMKKVRVEIKKALKKSLRNHRDK